MGSRLVMMSTLGGPNKCRLDPESCKGSESGISPVRFAQQTNFFGSSKRMATVVSQVGSDSWVVPSTSGGIGIFDVIMYLGQRKRLRTHQAA